MAKQLIVFKDKLMITAWLDTALKKEREKYERCPVIPDAAPGHEAAQGWGYVVAGYFLLEQSLKALLYVRGKNVRPIHPLSSLFDECDQNDKRIIREYYVDFQATIGGNIGAFPLRDLDSFLANLDGDDDRRGSFDWRYFLIEEKQSVEMPLVSVDYMHEVVYGVTRIVECAMSGHGNPRAYTRSLRMRLQRKRKYTRWLTDKMNSYDWDQLDDRLEILWGPDYRDCYDLLLFEGTRARDFYGEIPAEIAVPIVDKRAEIENFDAEDVSCG